MRTPTFHELVLILFILSLFGCRVLEPWVRFIHFAVLKATICAEPLTRFVGTFPHHGFQWAKLACFFGRKALAALSFESIGHSTTSGILKLDMQLTLR